MVRTGLGGSSGMKSCGFQIFKEGPKGLIPGPSWMTKLHLSQRSVFDSSSTYNKSRGFYKILVVFDAVDETSGSSL